MRVQLKRRKTLRNAGLATVLAAAALLLTGCWATVTNFGNGVKDIVVTKDMSAQVIWQCTVDHGTGIPRARCALDTFRALCHGIPVKGIGQDECDRLGSWVHQGEMDQAIQQVLGPDQDCLVYFETDTGEFWGSVGGAWSEQIGCK
jgi:hypothetical protein